MKPRLACVLPVALLMCSCITITQPETAAPLIADAGTGIVVGRIRVLDPEREQHPWNSEWQLGQAAKLLQLDPPPLRQPLLALFSVDSDERNLVPVPDADGWFCWELPPGRYLLYVSTDLNGSSSSKAEPDLNAPLKVLAAFGIDHSMQAAYIGDLLIEVHADWVVGSDTAQYAIVDLSVQFAPTDARRWVARHYPGSELETGPIPLVVDPTLSDLLLDYSKTRTDYILAGLGM